MSAMDDFEVFKSNAIFAKSLQLHYDQLTVHATIGDHTRMERVAPVFFGDMFLSLIYMVYLSVNKLLDPARDRQGNENHSVEFVIEHFNLRATALGPRLDEIQGRMRAFRALVAPARHKLIAHFDRSSALAGAPLGVAPKEDWDLFWADLEDVLDAVSNKMTGRGLRFSDIGRMTDADELLSALLGNEIIDQLAQSGNQEAVEMVLSAKR